VALVGPAAAADDREVRQALAQRAYCPPSSAGSPSSSCPASSNSAWLMREAFARMPAIRSCQASSPASSTSAKCVGCAQLTMK
jgi:hypothetical protein